eukprot:40686-Eustigmatos_ZCMA.PRE.1
MHDYGRQEKTPLRLDDDVLGCVKQQTVKRLAPQLLLSQWCPTFWVADITGLIGDATKDARDRPMPQSAAQAL